MESVPLQLAIFMALTSHVYYVRTGRTRHLVWAGVWVAFGLLFFEKALVLPLLLVAITAGFLVAPPSPLGGARNAPRPVPACGARDPRLVACYRLRHSV